MFSLRGFVVLAFGLFAPALQSAAEPPRPADDLPVDGDALPRVWVAPVWPADLGPRAGGQAAVRLRCIIDEQGRVVSARVLSSPDPRFNAPAVAAIKAWHFSPALRQSRPVASCLDLPMVFTSEANPRHGLLPPLAAAFKPAPFVEAKAIQAPDADYPASLVDRGLPGRVTLAWTVTPDGRPSDPQVLDSTHADFVLPALAALATWTFKPARQGDLPVASDLRGAIDFGAPNLTRSQILQANEVFAPDGSAPEDLPGLRRAPDPVYPFAALLAGATGEATVAFTVTDTGRVRDVLVQKASQPEFGQALAAALATWEFEPAIRNNQVVAVSLIKHASFSAGSGDPNDPAAALIAAARNHGIAGAAGLDGKLAVIFRVLPLYPPTLRAAGGAEGSALLELAIAKDGRVRLTRIVSASRDEFGWAAATAFSQWIFAPPRRGGRPVDVLVQVPVHFAAQHG
jgi:TonB family protein